jgi:uncharacterized protein (DUF433 family)
VGTAGYIRSSIAATSPRIYSFQDVAEGMVVHELLERDVRHRDILRAITLVEDSYGDWPLTEAPFGTISGKGRARIVLDQPEGVYDAGELGWQQVIEPENLDLIRRQLRRGGWAARTLDALEHIEVDPERLSGRPTIRGRRIAAADVAEIAQSRGGLDVLRDDYELDEDEIRDARRWWVEVRRLEAAA